MPQTLSYPLGARSIDEALVDCPNFARFELWFWSPLTFDGAEFRARVRELQPYDVVRLEYRPPNSSNYLGKREASAHDAKWVLKVQPVLREYRHLAATLIKSIGFPVVRDWLAGSDEVLWQSRAQQMSLVFCPADETLTIAKS